LNIVSICIVIIILARLFHYKFFYRYDLLEGRSVSTRTGLLGLTFREYDLDYVSIQLNQTLLAKIFGFGNITFEKDQTSGTRWFAISNAPDVLDYIQSLKAGVETFPTSTREGAKLSLAPASNSELNYGSAETIKTVNQIPMDSSLKKSTSKAYDGDLKPQDIPEPTTFEEGLAWIERITPSFDSTRRGAPEIMEEVKRLYPPNKKKTQTFQKSVTIDMPIELVWYQVLSFAEYPYWQFGRAELFSKLPDPFYIGVNLNSKKKPSENDKDGDSSYHTVLE